MIISKDFNAWFPPSESHKIEPVFGLGFAVRGVRRCLAWFATLRSARLLNCRERSQIPPMPDQYSLISPSSASLPLKRFLKAIRNTIQVSADSAAQSTIIN